MPKIENANPAPIATDELLDDVVNDIQSSEEEIIDFCEKNFPAAPTFNKKMVEILSVSGDNEKDIAKVCLKLSSNTTEAQIDINQGMINQALSSDKDAIDLTDKLSNIESFYVDRTGIEGYSKGGADDEIKLNEDGNTLKSIKFFKKPKKQCKKTNKYNKVIVIKYNTKDNEDQEIIVDMDNNMIISNDNQRLYWHSKDKDKGGTGFDVDGENVYIIGVYEKEYKYSVFAINNKIQKDVKHKKTRLFTYREEIIYETSKEQAIKHEYSDIIKELYKSRYDYDINIPDSEQFHCVKESYHITHYKEEAEKWINEVKRKIDKLYSQFKTDIDTLFKEDNKREIVIKIKEKLSNLNKEILSFDTSNKTSLQRTNIIDDKKILSTKDLIKKLKEHNYSETLKKISNILNDIKQKNNEIKNTIENKLHNLTQEEEQKQKKEIDKLKEQFLEEMREKVNNIAQSDKNWDESKTDKIMQKIQVKYDLGIDIDDKTIKQIIENIDKAIKVKNMQNIMSIRSNKIIYSNEKNYFNKIGEDDKNVFFLKYDAKNDKKIDFNQKPKIVKVRKTKFRQKYNAKEIMLKTDDFFKEHKDIITKENFEKKQLQLKDAYQDMKISIVGDK